MAICPKCSYDNAPDKLFCIMCGAGVTQAPGAAPAHEPEHKSGIPAPPPNPFRQAKPPETALKPSRRKPQPAPEQSGKSGAETDPAETAPQTPPTPQAGIPGALAGHQAPNAPTEPGDAPAAKPCAGAQPIDKSTLPPLFQPPQQDKKSSAPMSPSFGVALESATPDQSAQAWQDIEDLGPDSAEHSQAQDLFQRKPWLARVLGFGCMLFFLLPAVIAITVNEFRQSAALSRAAAQQKSAAQAAKPANRGDCIMRADIISGDVRVQSQPGTNFKPLAQGDCAEPGAALMTGPSGRLQLQIKNPATTLFINAQTSLFLNPAAQGLDRAPSLLRLQQGEIWLSSAEAADPVRLALPLAVISAQGTGEFHFLARGDQSYITSASGALQIQTPASTSPMDIASGQQIILGRAGKDQELKDIDREKFMRWVSAWKDNMSVAVEIQSPHDAAGADSTTGTVTTKPADEPRNIIDTVLSSPPAPLPDHVDAAVVSHTAKWAIAKTTDNRPDSANNQDFWPQTAVLLKKEPTGHWRALEFFVDYSDDLFVQWSRRYAFTKNDAKALGLQ
jgi:hypothetical protein